MAELLPFAGSAETVVRWLASPEEAVHWSGVTIWPVPDALFARWHAEPGVVPFLLVDGGGPAAYGELWEDETEVELARLLVDPRRRGRGIGRRLVAALVAEARGRGCSEIWLRVASENEQAIRCYRGAGFVRATPDEETEFNLGQPRAYVWMRHGPVDEQE